MPNQYTRAHRKVTDTISLPVPHPGQIIVLDQSRRFNWLSAGRRWWKTTLAMTIAVEAALEGTMVLWGAPTHDQVRIGWSYAKKSLAGYAVFHETNKECMLPNAGTIIYRSLDEPDNARGHTAGLAILDECGDIKEEAWVSVIKPILFSGQGTLWAMGTPRGKNWFWEEHTDAINDPDSIAWQIPTVGCKITKNTLVEDTNELSNPNYPFKDILKEFNRMPIQVFRQEYMAEFLEDSNDVFRNIASCIKLALTDASKVGPLGQHRYAIGVDWGKFKDFSVFTVLDITTKEVVQIDRFNNLDYRFQMGRLKALVRKWRPFTVIVEANAMGEPIIERLEHEADIPIERFITGGASKKNIIESLALALEREDLKLLKHDALLKELSAYQAKRLPSGQIRYTAPRKQHDDCVMSLALVWSALAEASGQYMFTAPSPTRDWRG